MDCYKGKWYKCMNHPGGAPWGLPLSNIMLGRRSIHAVESCGSSPTPIADGIQCVGIGTGYISKGGGHGSPAGIGPGDGHVTSAGRLGFPRSKADSILFLMRSGLCWSHLPLQVSGLLCLVLAVALTSCGVGYQFLNLCIPHFSFSICKSAGPTGVLETN